MERGEAQRFIHDRQGMARRQAQLRDSMLVVY